MKITDLKVIYICPDHNPKYNARKVHMDALLTRIGFTHIEHYKSGTEAYPTCLINATIDVLQKNMDEPILLLEDDVEFTGVDTVTLDASADAIYLGLSKSAGSPTRDIHTGEAQFKHYSDTQVRVLNMLATHAILYISHRYKQAVIDAISPYRAIPYNSDVIISRIQKDYIILANNTPSFYQSAKFNPTKHVENVTRIVVKQLQIHTLTIQQELKRPRHRFNRQRKNK
jgi:hypothetical protein